LAGGEASPLAAADDREPPPAALAQHTGLDLNDLLYAALSETEKVLLYGHASELETLLEEAIALADHENLYTLDMLILLAGDPATF
jgi:hypothetical protein